MALTRPELRVDSPLVLRVRVRVRYALTVQSTVRPTLCRSETILMVRYNHNTSDPGMTHSNTFT